MQIKWLGHSSFLITSKNGTKILMDPFDSTIGYNVYKGDADIVSISHHHFDHNCLKYLKGDYMVIDKIGEFNIKNIKIKGFKTYHDKFYGAKRGENIIFRFEIDGLVICHLGDLGHMLTDEEISSLGNIDILLIPIGGNYTIDNIEAYALCEKIKSNIVIPMHYKTPNLNFELLGLENFLIKFEESDKINTTTFNIENNYTLTETKNKLLILDY